MRARGLREQLAAEADAEQRRPPGDELTDQLVFHDEPGMLVLLVDVHVPAEDEERVVRLERPRRLRVVDDRPLLERVPVVARDVGEQLRANQRAVGQRQDPHQKSVAFACAGSIAPVAATPASSSSPRSTCALRGA